MRAKTILYQPVLIAGLMSLAIYAWATLSLGSSPSAGFLLLLAAPCVIYVLSFRDNCDSTGLQNSRTAAFLLTYALLYCASIYLFPLLGASVTYWAVQFLLPILILKVSGESIGAIHFQWTRIFSDPLPLLLSFIVLVPILVFSVRDSAEIIPLFQSWKILIYLPASILFMVVVAAFWEEFLFRGIVMQSVLRLTSSPSIAIFVSSLLFGTYHIPMRYLNERSPYHGDLVQSVAATLDEQFMMGIALGVIVYKSRNVWHGIWIHAIFNGVSFVYKFSQMVKF